jgi:hypothetical protein
MERPGAGSRWGVMASLWGQGVPNSLWSKFQSSGYRASGVDGFVMRPQPVVGTSGSELGAITTPAPCEISWHPSVWVRPELEPLDIPDKVPSAELVPGKETGGVQSCAEQRLHPPATVITYQRRRFKGGHKLVPAKATVSHRQRSTSLFREHVPLLIFLK